MKLIETIWNPTVLIYSLKLHFWDGNQNYQHDRREVYFEIFKDNLDQNDAHSKIFELSVINLSSLGFFFYKLFEDYIPHDGYNKRLANSSSYQT